MSNETPIATHKTHKVLYSCKATGHAWYSRPLTEKFASSVIERLEGNKTITATVVPIADILIVTDGGGARGRE